VVHAPRRSSAYPPRLAQRELFSQEQSRFDIKEVVSLGLGLAWRLPASLGGA